MSLFTEWQRSRKWIFFSEKLGSMTPLTVNVEKYSKALEEHAQKKHCLTLSHKIRGALHSKQQFL